MNVVTAASPLAVPDCRSPYFDQFPYGCWPSFEETLELPGKAWLGEGSGVYDGTQLFEASSLPDFPSDVLPDWPVSLLTPEDQPGLNTALSSPFPSPHPSPQAEPLTVFLTPDSSLPSSPQSSSCYYSDDPELNDVMCSLLMEDDYQFSPNAILPVGPAPDATLPVWSTPDSSGSPGWDLPESNIEVPQALPKDQPSSSRKRKCSSDQPPTKGKLNKTPRKERKREQNKTAALKYRKRKKKEKMSIDDKEKLLEEQNKLLRSDLEAMTNEIQYLKKLWREICEAKQRPRC